MSVETNATFHYKDPYTGKPKIGRNMSTVTHEGSSGSGLHMKLEMLLPNRGEWVPIAYPIEDWIKENK